MVAEAKHSSLSRRALTSEMRPSAVKPSQQFTTPPTLGAARYDLAFQLGGTYSPAAVRKVLTPRGTLIQSSGDGSRWLGPVGNIVKAVALNALAGQTLKSFTAKVTAQALTEVGGPIESGYITPVIDRSYPLTDAAAAVALVEEGSPAGKVIVTVEPPPPELPPHPSANTPPTH